MRLIDADKLKEFVENTLENKMIVKKFMQDTSDIKMATGIDFAMATELLKDVVKYIDEQPAEAYCEAWTPKEKKLPPDYSKVLIDTENGITIGWHVEDGGSWNVLQWYITKDRITRRDLRIGNQPAVMEVPISSDYVRAWMPLPEKWVWNTAPDM